MDVKVVWNNEELYGCEYLNLGSTTENLVVQSTVIYVDEKNSDAHKLNYIVELNKHWLTKKCSINVNNNNSLELHTDGEGNWFNSDGELIDSLEGAIDIDISATPFSNTLPINRINWSINQIELFHMVYISIPSLKIKKVPQSYQYIRMEGELRYFKYRCYDFETIICVDSSGLVVKYPDTFSRVL
ncbi:putative glycolipid-binding domain-containing protein [Aquibacillus koreensis]|uniref:Glycolipid-binding domain-containing protein n=1 Tax=Aquibacillus koreensis TaxID=279446 RepID=A0A9X4AH06_9BACI|nr:putative glycolipid-binding domain-containing protein [Aquibacillus koreensis]MCT2536424.1 putative glycolipid-binding domain-containing protein [Aquibacillus koreensis]MDC3419486.1 putative glycolipid-binding domain-containing protein [Aquibacillus koreensis]